MSEPAATVADGRRPQAPPGTVTQHTLAELRRQIVSGELGPGQRVRQDELAAALGVSIAPVREALAMLEQEGQVTYLPRRGYFVTELRIEDLEEFYALRQLLEERAVRHALASLDEDGMQRLQAAARDCDAASDRGDISAELAANRRFHFALMDSPDQPHTLRVIKLLWDSTEAYRALYYNSPEERRNATDAHARIIVAACAGDGERLIRELDEHRQRALVVIREIFRRSAP